MEEKRRIIDEFASLVSNEVAKTVEQNISFSVLEGVDRIVILQSTAVHIVAKLMGEIDKVNPKMRYVIIGRDECLQLKELFPNVEIDLVEHNKVFGDEDIDMVNSVIMESGIDSVLFFNNFVNSVDFSNVEHILTFINSDILVYSYSYVQGELNKHNNLPCQIYGGIVYKDIVEWYKTII